ncbi:MAG: LUD domain-containing protein [Odoribacteraceae bacterium]|jgi:L-lactate dehydrogenase complex protein LldG|nr:LUD domain-containing protein [Odoribacteraceae bacterium]
MTHKDEILARLRRRAIPDCPMPDVCLEAITYPDKVKQFTETLRLVGGDAVELTPGDDPNRLLRELYPDARVIASNLPGVTIATVNPDDLADPRDLDGVHLAVVAGDFGVAENGAVWITHNTKERALYFIPDYLAILLHRADIVNNMHEAYGRARVSAGFGVFISGPSKTADIEQSLVIGAHGAKGLTVIIL